jgi:transcriptional regulator with XRE-family HTH domain
MADRGARLEQWWRSKGWRKSEFAERMKIWPQNVNKYFSGELDPTNLAEQLVKEDCDVVWIIDGKTGGQSAGQGIVAETPAVYSQNNVSKKVSKLTRERIRKLARLLESGSEKTDEEMLDILIKTMEEKQKKKGKL